MRFRSPRANLAGLLPQLWVPNKQFARCRGGSPRDLERLALEEELLRGHQIVAIPRIGDDAHSGTVNQQRSGGLRGVIECDDRKIIKINGSAVSRGTAAGRRSKWLRILEPFNSDQPED
jgi:hypothetical protein